jgi:hypothetical protein
LTDEAFDFLETIFHEFDGDFVCHASPQSFLGIISTGLYRCTICKLIISFPFSRIRCCNPVNLKNCFLLLRKGRLLMTFPMLSNFSKDLAYVLVTLLLHCFLRSPAMTFFYMYAFPKSECQLGLLAMLFDIL